MKKRNHQKGFTIIELLVAIAAASVFLVVLYAIYFQVQEVTRQRARYANRSSLVFSSLGLLIQDFNSMVFESWNKQTLLLGQKENCSLGTCSRVQLSVGSLHGNANVFSTNVFRVTYFIKEEDGKATLFRRQDNFFTPDNERQAPAIPMLKNITEFFIEYSPDGTSWQDEWDVAGSTSPQAPQIFRINISYENSITDNPQNNIRSFHFLLRPGVMSN